MILYGQPMLISVENSPTGTWLIVRGEVDIATATQLRESPFRDWPRRNSVARP